MNTRWSSVFCAIIRDAVCSRGAALFTGEPFFAGRVEYSTPAVVDPSFVCSFLACFMRVLVVLEEARAAPPDMFGKSKEKKVSTGVWRSPNRRPQIRSAPETAAPFRGVELARVRSC